MTHEEIVIFCSEEKLSRAVDQVLYGIEEEGGISAVQYGQAPEGFLFLSGDGAIRIDADGCRLFVKEGHDEGYLLECVVWDPDGGNSDFDAQTETACRRLGQNAVRYAKRKKLLHDGSVKQCSVKLRT